MNATPGAPIGAIQTEQLLSHLLAVGVGVPGDRGGVALGHHGDILDYAVVTGSLNLLQPRHQQSQEADQDPRHPGRITSS